MVQACLFAKIALQTQAEYFYAGSAETLKKVYETLSARLTLEKKETEISGLLAPGRRPAGDRLGGAVDSVVQPDCLRARQIVSAC